LPTFKFGHVPFCAIAVGFGFVAQTVFDDLMKRIAYRRMRGLYGQEWNTES